MPADFMKLIVEKSYGPTFFITSRDGRTTEIWPMQEWEIEEAKKAVLPEDDPAKTTWMRVVNYFGGVVEIDKQDRLMLPRKIREKFGMVNVDVVVAGQQKFLAVQIEAAEDQAIAELVKPATEIAAQMTIMEARRILASREAAAQQG